MPAAAGQLSMRTMASCYNCCAHSLPGPIVPFVVVCIVLFTTFMLPLLSGVMKIEIDSCVNKAVVKIFKVHDAHGIDLIGQNCDLSHVGQLSNVAV